MSESSCEATQIKYSGDGTTKKFTFPFSYMHFYDVQAALWDDSKREYIDQTNLYILADATTVEFLTAPPVPPESAPNGLNIIIYRRTSLDAAETTFYPGSSIRAKDLNADFDQLRLAIQEGRCGLENEREDTTNKVWNRESIKGRDDLQDPQAPFDTMYRNDQIAGRWYGDNSGTRRDQEAIPTTGAVSERLDPYVQGSLPPETEVGYGHQVGKVWQNTEDSWTSYWNTEADAWVAYVNTGPRGETGSTGAVGPQGPSGPPLAIQGTIPGGAWVEPDPKEVGDIWICEGEITGFPGGGTPQEDDAITWNGERWVNTGPIGIEGKKGEKGDVGPQGLQGIQGEKGDKGDKGDTGNEGPAGLGINYKGQVAVPDDLPSNPQPNDAWQSLDSGDLWVWNGSVWQNVGSVSAGEDGEDGATGPQGPFFDIAALPPLPPVP